MPSSYAHRDAVVPSTSSVSLDITHGYHSSSSSQYTSMHDPTLYITVDIETFLCAETFVVVVISTRVDVSVQRECKCVRSVTIRVRMHVWMDRIDCLLSG